MENRIKREDTKRTSTVLFVTLNKQTHTVSALESPVYPQKSPIYLHKSPIYPQMSTKEPYISAKESDIESDWSAAAEEVEEDGEED